MRPAPENQIDAIVMDRDPKLKDRVVEMNDRVDELNAGFAAINKWLAALNKRFAALHKWLAEQMAEKDKQLSAAKADVRAERARADAMAKALAGSIYREQTAVGAPKETIANKIVEATGSDVATARQWVDELAAVES